MDPISAFGLVAGAFQVTSLITDTAQGLSTLRGRFRDADLTIHLLIVELTTIKSAIAQLHDWSVFNSKGGHDQREYIADLDVALDGCQAIMDVLSEEVAALSGRSLSSDHVGAGVMGLRARARVVWNEDRMKDYQGKLHAQVLALQVLLQACQWYDPSPLSLVEPLPLVRRVCTAENS